MNDQRHMHGRVVDEKSVRLLPVLPQTFAMVSSEHNHRILIKPFLLQIPHQSANLLVRKRNLPIIGTVGILMFVGLGRVIRKMRIVQMHPQKKLLLRRLSLPVLSQPLQRDGRHFISGTFHFVDVLLVQSAEIEVVVVKIETVVQSKPRIEHRRRDHRPGRISRLLQHRCHGRLRWAELVSGEVMHPAQHRIRPRQHRRMRRQCHWNHRKRPLKARSIRRQPIHIRSLDLLVSIATDMIRAQRINRNQHHVQAGLTALRRRRVLRDCNASNQYRKRKYQPWQSSVTSVTPVVQAFPRPLNESFPSVYPNAAPAKRRPAQPVWYADP